MSPREVTNQDLDEYSEWVNAVRDVYLPSYDGLYPTSTAAIASRVRTSLRWILAGQADNWLPLDVRELFSHDLPALIQAVERAKAPTP